MKTSIDRSRKKKIFEDEYPSPRLMQSIFPEASPNQSQSQLMLQRTKN